MANHSVLGLRMEGPDLPLLYALLHKYNGIFVEGCVGCGEQSEPHSWRHSRLEAAKKTIVPVITHPRWGHKSVPVLLPHTWTAVSA